MQIFLRSGENELFSGNNGMMLLPKTIQVRQKISGKAELMEGRTYGRPIIRKANLMEGQSYGRPILWKANLMEGRTYKVVLTQGDFKRGFSNWRFRNQGKYLSWVQNEIALR